MAKLTFQIIGFPEDLTAALWKGVAEEIRKTGLIVGPDTKPMTKEQTDEDVIILGSLRLDGDTVTCNGEVLCTAFRAEDFIRDGFKFLAGH